MSEKKRKIIDMSQNEIFFNLDIRISIPKTNISQELIDDLLINKDRFINGSGNELYYVKIKENENGNDILNFGSDYFFGVE